MVPSDPKRSVNGLCERIDPVPLSQWLQERLLKNRFLAPYLRLVDGDRPMTTRTRIAILAMIWAATTISMMIFHARGSLSTAVGIALAAAALVGSVVVWRFRRERAA